MYAQTFEMMQFWGEGQKELILNVPFLVALSFPWDGMSENVLESISKCFQNISAS